MGGLQEALVVADTLHPLAPRLLPRFLAQFGILIAVLAACSGCATVSYYGQAVVGHLDMMARSRPIDERLDDPNLQPELRSKLSQAMEIREFASRELNLPANGSYRRYADLDRPYAVWNVFAAPEFSVKPLVSCFPFVGCVSYRGYYSKAAAEEYAGKLRDQGNDVFTYGVPAYSTLGWFDDPVLNTFIRYPEAELARLIFHELAHQVVYVKNDSTFNESFAVAVEEEGTHRWMARDGTESARITYAALRQRRADFIGLVLNYRDKLEAFYRQPATDEARRAGKRQLVAAMVADYEQLKAQRWSDWTGYDRWFEKGVNNAQLASVATYERFVPAFRALISRAGGDMQRFYADVRQLAQLDKDARDAALAKLTSVTEASTAR